MDNPLVAVFPICETYTDPEGIMNKSRDLGFGVSIGPTPAWARNETITRYLSFRQRYQLEHYRDRALVMESASQGDTAWQPLLQRYWLVNLALWLVKPTSLTCEFVVIAGNCGGTWEEKHDQDVDPLYIFDDLRHSHYNEHDLLQAAALLKALESLPDNGAVRAAVHMTWTALASRHWHVRYLLLWVALEGIFGPQELGETTYQIAIRLAKFIGASDDERMELYRLNKRSYQIRSSIVHSINLPSKKVGDAAKSARLHTETCVRRAFMKILGDAALMNVLSGKDRDKYFATLILDVRSMK